MNKKEFIKEMLELGAQVDQSCSEIEKLNTIKEAEIFYDNHLRSLTIADLVKYHSNF